MGLYLPSVGDTIVVPSVKDCLVKNVTIGPRASRAIQCIVTDIRGNVRIEWVTVTIFTRTVVSVDDYGRRQELVSTGGTLATLLNESETYDVLFGKTIKVVQGKVVQVARFLPLHTRPCSPVFDTVVYDYDLVEA